MALHLLGLVTPQISRGTFPILSRDPNLFRKPNTQVSKQLVVEQKEETHRFVLKRMDKESIPRTSCFFFLGGGGGGGATSSSLARNATVKPWKASGVLGVFSTRSSPSPPSGAPEWTTRVDHRLLAARDTTGRRNMEHSIKNTHTHTHTSNW